MAGKQVSGDGIPANLAGMSKNQLYEIMTQMKILIEQNQKQARQILIQNPLLTKALFQAQIMLGMVKSPQVVPSVLPPPSQHPQQSAQPLQQPNIQATQALPGQVGLQDQTSVSQSQTSIRKQHQNQPAMPISSASVPVVNLQSQPMHLYPLQVPQQPKGHLNPQTTMSHPQSSQLSNMPAIPHHSAAQRPSLHQPQMPADSSQLQQSLQSTGPPHMPLQPPLPQQPRPSSMQSFHHQYASHMGTNMGFQHSGAQQHPSQPAYHSGAKPPGSIGPSFQQGQPRPQSLYQAGGSHMGSDFSNQIGSSMPLDRGSWMSGPPENPAMTRLPGPPPAVPGQMGPGNQPPRPLSPDMEKALLQQVMSLTPEQISQLPPEQRNQVLQLQQILRQ